MEPSSSRRTTTAYDNQRALDFMNYAASLERNSGPRRIIGRKLGYAMASLATIAVISFGGCTDKTALMQDMQDKLDEASATISQKFEEYKAEIDKRFGDAHKRFNDYYTKSETDASGRALEARLGATENNVNLARRQGDRLERAAERLERIIAAQQGTDTQSSALPHDSSYQPKTAVSQYPLDPAREHAWISIEDKTDGRHYYLVIRPVILAREAPSATWRAVLKDGQPTASWVPDYPIKLEITEERFSKLIPNPISRFEIKKDEAVANIDYSGRAINVYTNHPHAASLAPDVSAMPRALVQPDVGGIPVRNDYLSNPRVK